jgi:membrane-associated phospholipid phosphatase
MNPFKDTRPEHLKAAIYLAVFLSVLLLFMLYLDGTVIGWIRRFKAEPSPLLSFVKSIDPVVDFLTHGSTAITASVLVYIYGRLSRGRLSEVGKMLIIGYLSSGIGAQVLKHLFGRARPRLTDGTVFIGPTFRSSYDSFVSGHTAVSFCLAFILSSYYPRYRLLFYAFAVLTALWRLEGPSHFPSDLLGGALFGILAAEAVMRLVRPSSFHPASKGAEINTPL